MLLTILKALLTHWFINVITLETEETEKIQTKFNFEN